MPTVKAKLLAHRKERNEDGHITELKAWIVPETVYTPRGLKYSVVYIVNGVRVIGYDNEMAKVTIAISQVLKSHMSLSAWRSF